MSKLLHLLGLGVAWQFARWRRTREASVAIDAAVKLLAHAAESDEFATILNFGERVLTDDELVAYSHLLCFLAELPCD